MVRDIDGIVLARTKEYAICHIEYFSNELKNVIREHLAAICHGSAKTSTGRIMYSYKATIKEFLNRYEKKPPKTQKGLIGELLTHIIISEFFPEYDVISPYFNLEERSIKKGFDIVLISKEEHDLFIIEVKSGEKHKGKSSDETINDLIGTAKNDLLGRLNDENLSLWHNAINGAQCVLEKNDDYKKAIIDVLEDMGDKSAIGLTDSKDINVFLTGVLFANFSDRISGENIKTKIGGIINKGEFKSIFGLSMQKETYRKVYQFLKDEGL